MTDKKTSTRDISHDDKMAFRESVGEVRRIKHDRTLPETLRPKPRRIRQPSHFDLTDESEINKAAAPFNEGEYFFSRAGVKNKELRQLRQGTLTIDADLDLHGLIIPQAHRAVEEFIHECTLRRIRYALIIHGKGYSSEHEPVLKNRVDIWLRRHNSVLAFCPAQQRHGGSGAIYVLIRLPA